MCEKRDWQEVVDRWLAWRALPVEGGRESFGCLLCLCVELTFFLLATADAESRDFLCASGALSSAASCY